MSRCPTITEVLYRQALDNSELCDVTLTFGDHVMGAHWGVLFQCPFFLAMFNSGMKEKQEGKIHIDDDFDGGLEVFLRYLYTSTATLNLSNVHGVLCAADYFQMNALIELCEKYLSEVTWTLENCIDIYYLAKRFRLSFYNKLMEYVTNNFLKILDFEDNGLYVTSDMMLEIADLVDTRRAVESNEQVLFMTRTEDSNNGLSQETRFKYLRKWLNFNVSDRRDTFTSLFLKLHLENTSHAFFQSLASDYIQNFNECREHYYKIRRESMLSQIKHDDKLSDAVLVVAEVCDDNRWSGLRNHCLFGYKLGVNKWAFLGKIPNILDNWCGNKRLIAVNKVDNCIYVCGNQQFDRTVDNIIFTVQKFNIVSKSWCKCDFSIPTCLDGEIRIKKIVSVEKYFCFLANIETNWGANTDVTLFLFDGSELFDNVSLCKTGWSSEIDIKMSVVENRYIVVLCNVIAHSNSGTVKKVKVIIKDIITKKTKRLKSLAQTLHNENNFYDREEFMFVSKDGVIISKVDSPFYRTLNVVNGHCSTVNDTIIPRTVFTITTNTEEEEEEDDEEYYDFDSGNGFNSMSIYNRMSDYFSIYDFETRNVTKLPNLPYWIVPGSITHVKSTITCSEMRNRLSALFV